MGKSVLHYAYCYLGFESAQFKRTFRNYEGAVAGFELLSECNLGKVETQKLHRGADTVFFVYLTHDY